MCKPQPTARGCCHDLFTDWSRTQVTGFWPWLLSLRGILHEKNPSPKSLFANGGMIGDSMRWCRTMAHLAKLQDLRKSSRGFYSWNFLHLGWSLGKPSAHHPGTWDPLLLWRLSVKHHKRQLYRRNRQTQTPPVQDYRGSSPSAKWDSPAKRRLNWD